jgi:hypothetical protein
MNKTLRLGLKRLPSIKRVVLTWRALRNKFGHTKKLSLINNFFSDLRKYKTLKHNPAFSLHSDDLKPMILDKTADTPVDPVYFYQDSWCAKKIFENKPTQHVDVASEAGFIGIISQFVPTTMIDIRPINLSQEGFSFKAGSILALPLGNNSVESLSSICVIEHIGLGRYGDPLDQFGSEKSAEELKRVLANKGNLYISVPVDRENKVCFNAHRAFTRDYVLKLFSPLKLIEEKYIYGRSLFDQYDATKGFGTGMYHFLKQ